MEINKAEFIASSPDVKDCPPGKVPEYAFIGRSNVGKSTLINYLTDNKYLAKTSSKPGKTVLINHFLIDDSWFLVDLPGYGYAKLSKREKAKIEKLIHGYILQRQNLMCLVVLIDSRHELQKIDAEFMAWLGKKGVPFVMAFTKTDKLSKRQLALNFEKFESDMLKQWAELPQYFFTSAMDKKGKEEILEFIQETNALFQG